MRCPWLLAETKVATIGLSGVRVLPLAAGINEGGHYFRYFGLTPLLYGYLVKFCSFPAISLLVWTGWLVGAGEKGIKANSAQLS